MASQLTPRQKDIILSIRNGESFRVYSLIAVGSDPNFAVGPQGLTPLHEAVKVNHFNMVKALVYARAYLNAETVEGKTPLDLAREVADPRIARFLREHGAKTGVEVRAGKAPVQTPETLAEKFSPDKWIGKIEEMQAEWKKVPADLKKKFNFASALTRARRQTMQQPENGENPPQKPQDTPKPE